MKCLREIAILSITSLLQGLLLEQAKTRRDDLKSLLDGEIQPGSSHLDWKDVYRLLQCELAVRQEAMQILKLMLLHWCSPNGKTIPVANVFNMLRLVTIRHGLPTPLVRTTTETPLRC